MPKLLFEKESYNVLGACIAVHKKLGNGFSEEIYQEALQKEFAKRNLPYEKQKNLELFYDGMPLDKPFVADFVCYDKIILQVEVMHALLENLKRQMINSLKATNFELGLLINFGEESLKWNRLINTPN